MTAFTPGEIAYLQSQRLGFRLRPRRIVSWGIDGEMTQQNARSVG